MSDYDRIAEAISFIVNRVNSQPGLEEIARHLHLSPFHFQRLFSRWAGVTPKKFLQVLTVERAKQLLSESKPLLEVSDSPIGHPRSARAVGLAVGANPVALLIPCHRVIQQSGKLGGYHWGETRKQAIHAWESARDG